MGVMHALFYISLPRNPLITNSHLWGYLRV